MSNKNAKEPYLIIRNLTQRYGKFTALDNISISIYEGQLVCFLGPSGCGKTTLLRCIAGLDFQAEGKILQAGRDISLLPSSQRDFGIVFQSYALFPNLTAYQNIAFGLQNQKLPKQEIKARVNELLETVGLPGKGDKYAAQLSGGEQQRVALARALALSPGLLLLDEPLSALDAKVRVRLRREIKALQKRLGVTTIMVTHDQEEAQAIADLIVVMNCGSIEQAAAPIEIYNNPSSSFVAEFVGVMNFLPGEISRQGQFKINDTHINLGNITGTFNNQEKVSIAFRPEDIRILNGKSEMENAFEVVIREIEFLGPFFRVVATCNRFDEYPIIADFSAEAARGMQIEDGTSVNIQIPAEKIKLFPQTQCSGEDG